MVKFEAELKRLGLKEKEAAIYLSCLQLGSAPVQQIARKAKIVRATAYVILESLMKQGLVTKYEEGKKTLFSAAPPTQLMRLLELQEEEIGERKKELESLLPELQVLRHEEGVPTVRYYEGREGLHAMRQEILMYTQTGDVIYNFTPMEHLNSVFPQNMDSYNKQRVAKGIHSKTIFTTSNSKLRDLLLNKPHAGLSERAYVPPEMFSSASGMTVFRDRVAMGSFSGRLMGVVIDSEPLARMMRELFNIAWEGAKHIQAQIKED